VGLGRWPIRRTKAARHDLSLAALQPAFGYAFDWLLDTGGSSVKMDNGRS